MLIVLIGVTPALRVGPLIVVVAAAVERRRYASQRQNRDHDDIINADQDGPSDGEEDHDVPQAAESHSRQIEKPREGRRDHHQLQDDHADLMQQ